MESVQINRNLELPDRPSELLRAALDDLRAAEMNPRLVIMMDRWHEPMASGRCAVCLAGAVIARRQQFDTRHHAIAPGDFPGRTQLKLRALDFFRRGHVNAALVHLYVSPEQRRRLPSWADVAEYSSENPGPFHESMGKLVSQLQAAGL